MRRDRIWFLCLFSVGGMVVLLWMLVFQELDLRSLIPELIGKGSQKYNSKYTLFISLCEIKFQLNYWLMDKTSVFCK